MTNKFRHLGTDLCALIEVKIYNAKGKLVKTVIAKRLEGPGQHEQTKKAVKAKAARRAAHKKLKASDLIEL